MQQFIQHRRAHGRIAGQSGFALMVALFVIFMTSVLVVALIGLSFATTGLSTSQDTADRRSRAADSALETALNQVARDATGNLGFPPQGSASTDCTVGGTFQIGDVVDGTGSLVRSGEKVAVGCESLKPAGGGTSQLLGVAKTDANGAVSLDGIQVIGDEYRGDHGRTTGGANAWTTQFPWSKLLGSSYTGSAAAIQSTKASVVHSGPAPLSITSDMTVSAGAAAARTDADPTTLTRLDAALGVTGTYTQGNDGLLYSPSHTITTDPNYDPNDSANKCGVLRVANGSYDWKIPGAAIRSGGGSTCSDTATSRVDWRTPGVTSPAPASWTPAAITAKKQTVSSGCNGGSRVFNPGAYDKVATAALNSLFAGCNNTLFNFTPGDYWFDADSGTSSNRSAIVFGNGSNRVVFGTLTSPGGEASTFPQACNPNAAGVSLTLSPRTSIRHTAGRVAICGQNGPSSPAIWQASGANTGWIPTQPTVNASGFTDGSPTGANAPDDGQVATAIIPCSSEIWGPSCFGTKTISLSGFVSTGDPGDATITSVQILAKGTETRAMGSGGGVRADVYIPNPSTGDPAGTLLCQSTLGALPEGNQMVAYELLNPNSTCRTLLTSRAQLVNATIKVRFDLGPDCGLIGLLCINGPTVNIDYLGVRVPWTPALPTPASGAVVEVNPTYPTVKSGGVSTNAGWLVANDAIESEVNNPCNFTIASLVGGLLGSPCAGSDNKPSNLGIQNLIDTSDPESSDPNAQLESAALVLKGRSHDLNMSKSSIFVQITFGGTPQVGIANSCQFVVGGLAPMNNLPLYIDMLQGSCRSTGPTNGLRSPSQLVGARVQVTTYLNRDDRVLIGCIWPFCGGWGATVDYMGVSTTVRKPVFPDGTPLEQVTANSYNGPRAPFLVTSNNNPGDSSDAMFSVYGRVEVPRADIDVHWNGPYPIGVGDIPKPNSIAVTSIFNGTGPSAMVVNGIGSSTNVDASGSPVANGTGQVGVLCCGPSKPAERRVRLTVHRNSMAGQVLGSAVVLISDQSVDPSHPGLWAPGQRISIEDWTLCSPDDRNKAGSVCNPNP